MADTVKVRWSPEEWWPIVEFDGKYGEYEAEIPEDVFNEYLTARAVFDVAHAKISRYTLDKDGLW